MAKTLILVRHAHRDKNQGDDNGLSERGQRQAERAAAHVKNRLEEDFSDASIAVLSSPKRRCIETVAPLAQELKTQVETMNLLDEGSRLEARVEEFVEWWIHEAPQVTIVCSHGDWIPCCVFRMTGARVDLKKGAIAEITGPPAAPLLFGLVQKP
ncbi:MAG: histidine phosphatase family protein [Deltaproteobacteria bacterium]|nr:histidine phosphatase family protein [Deltaproteobacteria bacterium]